MDQSSAWVFRTTRGSVYVGPGELRIRRSLADTLSAAVSAVAGGRFPSAVRDVGWSVVAALVALGTVTTEWYVTAETTVQLFIGLSGALVALGGSLVSAARNRTATIPNGAIARVTFEDDALVIVHAAGEDTDDADSTEETVRPLDDDQRADAALALKLRGLDLCGVTADGPVSRTVVDAPETELVA